MTLPWCGDRRHCQYDKRSIYKCCFSYMEAISVNWRIYIYEETRVIGGQLGEGGRGRWGKAHVGYCRINGHRLCYFKISFPNSKFDTWNLKLNPGSKKWQWDETGWGGQTIGSQIFIYYLFYFDRFLPHLFTVKKGMSKMAYKSKNAKYRTLKISKKVSKK